MGSPFVRECWLPSCVVLYLWDVVWEDGIVGRGAPTPPSSCGCGGLVGGLWQRHGGAPPSLLLRHEPAGVLQNSTAEDKRVRVSRIDKIRGFDLTQIRGSRCADKRVR